MWDVLRELGTGNWYQSLGSGWISKCNRKCLLWSRKSTSWWIWKKLFETLSASPSSAGKNCSQAPVGVSCCALVWISKQAPSFLSSPEFSRMKKQNEKANSQTSSLLWEKKSYRHTSQEQQVLGVWGRGLFGLVLWC
jgi:hypothetical protein